MKRQVLKKMVIDSYLDGELDAKKINKIANLLSKKELRLYIKALKNWEKEHSIILEVADDKKIELGGFQDIFPDKKVVVKVDPSLLLGMKLYNNDDIFEMSLKNTLDKVTEHIKEQYD